MRTKIALALLMAGALAWPAEAAVNCGMAQNFNGPGSTPIWKAADGDVYFYRSNSDVDTDGSLTSYHPDDIAANKGLAENSICNGVSRKSGGATFSCVDHSGDCQKCYDHFRSVAKADMLARFTDYFSSFAIATKDKAACIAPGGYFVSTSSYEQAGKDVCDPARYLDADAYPAIAIPKSLYNKGVAMGDLVVVRNRDNDRIGYGLVYDTSGGRIGESSVAMNRQLLCQKNQPGCVPPPLPTSLKKSYALVIGDATFLVFKGTAGAWPTSPDEVAAKAKAAFDAWGGGDRLAACDKAYVH